MGNYRKKPVVIEARQYDGSPKSCREIIDWTRDSSTFAYIGKIITRFEDGSSIVDTEPSLVITTLEGSMAVGANDWVIRGVKGEHYPCKPDIFAATYEAVEVSHEQA